MITRPLFVAVCLLAGLAAAHIGVAGAQEIRNPFYQKPAWRLWVADQEPVEMKMGQNELKAAPLPESERKYPVFTEEWLQSGKGAPPLQVLEEPSGVAGSWDDAYMSLDNGHTNLRAPAGQFIIAGKLPYESYAQILHQMGVNFSSQSYAQRGRHIVDDTRTLVWTERNFTFANIVRASPSHASYEDKNADMVKDVYDGLYGHSYQSVGQSGSEIQALYKMMMAGASMDREVKDELKKHGVYALVLLTIFKQALPYADANGQALPYAHELRHRPAYTSAGYLGHPHYAPANPYYHAYDEDLHLYTMCRLAQSMKKAPPVAVLNLVGLELEDSDRATSATEAVVSAGLTSIRIWGKPGETIKARVDLKSCYTLDGQPFQVHSKVLYPEHKNITLTVQEDGIVEVVARHDPKLPKMRQPVLFFASNDSTVPSNPVFLNFFWPGENEVPDWPSGRSNDPKIRQAMNTPVNVNKRPVLADDLDEKILLAKPGETLSVLLDSSDPEGFPVEVFRRQREGGEIKDGKFTFTCPEDSAGRVFPFHFIFSDQTGAYSGARVKVLVQENAATLRDGWQHTVLGGTDTTGVVMIAEDGKLVIEGQGAKDGEGVYAYKHIEGDFDWSIPMVGFETDGTESVWGLVVRESLKDFSKQASVEIVRKGDKATGLWRARAGYSNWGRNKTDARMTESPKWLRLVRSGKQIAGFASQDGKTWEQMDGLAMDIPDKALVGIFVRGEKTSRLTSHYEEKPSGHFPVLSFEGKAVKNEPQTYEGALTLKLHHSGDRKLELMIDSKKQDVSGDIKLSEAGEYPIEIKILDGPEAGSVIRSRAIVKSAPEKKEE